MPWKLSPWKLSPWKSSIVGLIAAAAAPAQAHLQCVPYARSHSHVALHGDARTWWTKARGHYERGEQPAVGAVLAFRGTSHMPGGHVAVVSEILDSRRVLLDHANWSGPGRIEHAALAVDVSSAGDWSAVRVWHGPSRHLGLRTNPTFGFIYGRPADDNASGENATPYIHPDNVFWTDTRQARIDPQNVALFEG
ncbi:MAG: CHAP domain-containing protein [Sphingomonadales bacterium]|nr:CHAP domain-containing protein [Sphingomonadales bacterium]